MLEPDDRVALERLKRDQAYRDQQSQYRKSLWSQAAAISAVFSAIVLLAAFVAQFLHL